MVQPESRCHGIHPDGLFGYIPCIFFFFFLLFFGSYILGNGPQVSPTIRWCLVSPGIVKYSKRQGWSGVYFASRTSYSFVPCYRSSHEMSISSLLPDCISGEVRRAYTCGLEFGAIRSVFCGRFVVTPFSPPTFLIRSTTAM